MSGSMFSESWHRVAGCRARLNSEAEIRRHTFRGYTWYVVRDPLANSFARLSPPAHYFLCRLRNDRTIEEVWRECLHHFPDQAPTQQEVIQLLAQLTRLNLLTSDLPPDTTQAYARLQRSQGDELRGKFINFLYFRFHLFDPTWLLNTLLPLFRPLFTKWGALLWGILVLAGIKITLEHWRDITDQSNGIFAPSNLFLLYVAAIITKAWHELGHGLLCRYFGGEVRTLGIMLMLFTPLPYIDVSSSWAFPRRSQRMLVAAGGMVFEFGLAVCALFFWVSTSAGPWNALAYNMVVLASVTTLLFNINPLLRFDGYYIFSDLVEIPNLGQRATRQLRYLLERYVFLTRHSLSPAQTGSEGHWLWGYGVASAIYRVFLIWSIFFVLAERFLGIGLFVAMLVLFLWVALPLWKFLRYLVRDPMLDPVRVRAVGITLGTVGLLILFLSFVPMPNHFTAQGVVEADHYKQIYNESDGSLAEIVAPSGSHVHVGDVLIRIVDPLMEHKLEVARAQERQSLNALGGIGDDARVSLLPARTELAAAQDQLRDVLAHRQALELRAPMDGIWVATDLTDHIGAWLPRGSALGEIIDPSSFHFAAVVEQSQSADLFSGKLSAEIRLRGQSGQALRAGNLSIIPAQQHILPSAALGWSAGGEVETERDDPGGLQAKHPFFLVHAALEPQTEVYLAQRRTGVIRFAAAWEPLLTQITRKIRQVFQEKLR